jgi:hypothetical protein
MNLNSVTVNEKLICSSFIVIFILYVLSASPSIAGGDSGELVAEGCSLGTAHPPGYPLFTLLTWSAKKFGFAIFDEVVDNVAYRMNILSCLLTAGAAWFIGMMVQMAIPQGLYKEGVEDKRSAVQQREQPMLYAGGSVVAMGLFSFSPLIWQYAVTAEVFPLNTFFAALILYLVLSFARYGKFNTAVCGAFVCGLALTNQHTIVLYEAPLMLWMAWLLRHHLATNTLVVLGKLAGAFFAGLTPYLYLPLSAILYPESKGPSWGNVDTWSGFLHHFLRKDYGTLQLYSGSSGKNAEGFQVRTHAYIKDVTYTQGLYIATALAIVGIISWSLSKSTIIVENASVSPEKGLSSSRHHATSDFEAELSSGGTPCEPSKKELKRMKKKNSSNSNDIASNFSANSTEIGKNSTINNRIKSGLSDCTGDCGVRRSDARWTPLILLITQCFYFAIFHTLSNLPLGDKLLFGVHQRFWMQPNVLLFTWTGIGFNELMRIATRVSEGNFRLQAESSLIYHGPINKSGFASMNKYISFIISLLLVCAQYSKNRFISDQSGEYHFRSYARAILDPLPKNSLLLVNYDMQWTSLRYVSQCEGYRSDVTLINLSMMTYTWFHGKRKYFKQYTWPGTYLAPPNTNHIKVGGAFTLAQFLTANIAKVPIYLGGKVGHDDPALAQGFDNVPTGLVSRFVPMQSGPNGTIYQQYVAGNWQYVLKNIRELPDVAKYSEETWEWTIGRDFKDRIVDTAAYFLEAAIRVETVDNMPLINAVYWLESALLLENMGGNEPSSSLYKNAGLGHLHLVQNLKLDESQPLPLDGDWFNSAQAIGWPTGQKLDAVPDFDWKKWSADKFMEHWGKFLSQPDAKMDHQYDTIKGMYDQVSASMPNSSGNSKKKIDKKAIKSTKTGTKRNTARDTAGEF